MKSFKAWFGIGALMFGTYCGANMASGVYASAYIVTLGGGWALPILGMFLLSMSFFCAVGLDFARCFKTTNYNAYYMALYGLDKPTANPLLKTVVTIFFDIFTLLMGLVTVAACIALFAELMKTLLGIPTMIGCIFAVLLFAVLTIYGAGFLRKFNSVMTISLIISLAVILASVIAIRGDVLMERIGNFNIGPEWSNTTVKAHFAMFFSYCLTTSSWGSSLCNYSENLHTKRDTICSGILCGILVTSLFVATGAIILPFMPEVATGTPILLVCQKYLNPVLTIIYWVIVVFSVISTAPTFTYNVANRWSLAWKSEKVSTRVKFFTIAMVFLLSCWFISGVGLLAICQKGYTMLGKIALFAIVVPLLISIYRVWKKDRADKETVQV
ncbi:MAG: hypothetical protein VB096_07395 [Pseudoflavonifractor sp.]|nr:hypothetical protein [Pseudoflavonifractor sp.]